MRTNGPFYEFETTPLLLALIDSIIGADSNYPVSLLMKLGLSLQRKERENDVCLLSTATRLNAKSASRTGPRRETAEVPCIFTVPRAEFLAMSVKITPSIDGPELIGIPKEIAAAASSSAGEIVFAVLASL